MRGNSLIIVFTKPPVPGYVKTRLIGRLGCAGAVRLHQACVEDVIATAARLSGCSRRLLVAPNPDQQPDWPDEALLKGWTVGRQQGRDLGERLEQAVGTAFREGTSKVLVIGTDTPWMGSARLATALAWLGREDVVLGPTIDGGYYLAGASRPVPAMFKRIPWGSRSTLEATRARLDQAGLRYRFLAWDFDLDRPEDLMRARRVVEQAPERSPRLAAWYGELGRGKG